MKIYFAAPLFCEMERQRNAKECAKLEAAGFEVYLPQRDGGELVQGVSPAAILEADLTALAECDALIAYLDGRVPDEGVAFEMGFVRALKKPVMKVSTDSRVFEADGINVMLRIGPTFDSTAKAIDWLEKHQLGGI